MVKSEDPSIHVTQSITMARWDKIDQHIEVDTVVMIKGNITSWGNCFRLLGQFWNDSSPRSKIHCTLKIFYTIHNPWC